MRINKTLVDKGIRKGILHRRWHSNPSDPVEVDFDGIGKFLLAWTGIVGLLLLIIWIVGGIRHQQATDEKKYTNICDMMAGKLPHYITPSDAPNTVEACAIGPDWHVVNIWD